MLISGVIKIADGLNCLAKTNTLANPAINGR